MKIVLFNDLVFNVEHKGQNKEKKELYFVDITYKNNNINNDICNICSGFENGMKKNNILVRADNEEVIKIYD